MTKNSNSIMIMNKFNFMIMNSNDITDVKNIQ